MADPKIKEKRWTVDLEKKIQEEHFSKGQRYTFNPNSEKEIFVIDTPPPYPSGTWHIGAVAQYSMIDVIARSQRLLGKEVYFPWGVDRNGINIEFTVEKKTGRKMKTYDRAEFLDICRNEIEKYTQEMRNIAKRVGLSCAYDNEYLTDAPDYRAVTQSIFIDLFKRGDIVEELRPNLYDPVEGTTIAEAEVERLSRKTKLVDVRWSVTDDSNHTPIIISTTRPELICACGIVLVHPEDSRYEQLVGKTLDLPMETSGRSKTVEVQAHPSVNMEFGSGVLMVCSFGDQNDVSVFRELGLTPFQAIDLDGNITELGGPLTGLSVLDARKQAIEMLEESDRIENIVERDQEIPVSERGKNPIEIILLKEWYVRQTHIQERIKELSDEINFVPKRNKQFLLDWMENITIDWPVSRRRWYHTEIPIWYSEDRTKVVTPPHGTYVQPWQEGPPMDSIVMDRETRKELGNYSDLKSELGNLEGEEKVFDTWMDSSNSNLYVSGYLSNPELFERAFPTGIRPQGKEIVRTWLYYTLLKSTLLLDKPGFANVWIDGLGMDPWGRKMSKSLGNGIDAGSVLECGAGGRTGSWKIKGPEGKQVALQAKKIGSECFRFWKAADAQVGDDFQINPEQIELRYFGVLTKIFNVGRFASQFDFDGDLDTIPDDIENEDKWILAEFTELLENAKTGYSDLDIYTAAQGIKTFSTGVFASHWLEMAKTRLYNDDPSATWTLHRIFRDLLSILSPVCPFFTHHLSTTLYDKSAVDVDVFPESPISGTKEWTKMTDSLVDFNSAVWKAKKDAGISLAAPISGHKIPSSLESIKQALVSMHKLE
ncbi:MAG: class I tRNA ligase family protein [Candidatus Poseidoniia archaeon]|nr:class I tRNA ligase family protein [Candidatus Poseidoniia archaeon]